jgi:hypothetical protein
MTRFNVKAVIKLSSKVRDALVKLETFQTVGDPVMSSAALGL